MPSGEGFTQDELRLVGAVQIGKFNHLNEKAHPDSLSREITAADEKVRPESFLSQENTNVQTKANVAAYANVERPWMER